MLRQEQRLIGDFAKRPSLRESVFRYLEAQLILRYSYIQRQNHSPLPLLAVPFFIRSFSSLLVRREANNNG